MLINEADFKAAVPVAKNFTFSFIIPDIRRAELKYIKPILGKDLYSILDGAYEGNNTTTEQDALLDFVHPALAHIATWMYIPKGNVYFGDNGVMATHSDSSKPAFEWQKQDLMNSMRNNGFDALDEMIEHLEDVANVDFPDWLTSEGCTLVRENFINSAQRFTDFVPMLRGSRWLFAYIKPIMARIEKVLIMAITCKGLYDEIKAEIKADNVSAANLDIIEEMEGAVAHASWSSALMELALQLDDEGVHLANTTFAGTVKGKMPAEATRLYAVKDQHTVISAQYQEQLKDYLNENASTYPLFESSACYNSEITDWQIENKEDDGVYSPGL
jgi:hypothetical protein